MNSSGQLQIKKALLNDERPVLFVGYLYDGTVTSAIRPSDDPPNDVLRSSYKWNPNCVTGAPGGLACVEGRLYHNRRSEGGRKKRRRRSVDEKKGEVVIDLLEENMKRNNRIEWWERVPKERWYKQDIVASVGLIKHLRCKHLSHDCLTPDRLLMLQPWVGAVQRQCRCQGDHLWSVIISCKTSRSKSSLHISPLHHLTQSHQVIVTPFIV